MKVYVLQSDVWDVYRNLAYENALLHHIAELAQKGQQAAALFLWQNDKTVVIGRYQNPYKECNLEYMQKNGIQLARRNTGGGAVYHDKGNLNFTFVATHPTYDKQKNLQIILQALSDLGISAQLSGRNDILLDGKKFSGNAFKNGKWASLHHGTILISLSEGKADKCLTPSHHKLAKKGVDSVQSRIVNLSRLYKGIDTSVVASALRQNFINVFKGFAEVEKITDLSLNIRELYEKYASDTWIFDDFTPDDYTISGHFSWGEIGLNFTLKNGKIHNLKIATDSLDTELFKQVQDSLNGIKFTLDSLQSALSFCPPNVQSDIIFLLNQSDIG